MEYKYFIFIFVILLVVSPISAETNIKLDDKYIVDLDSTYYDGVKLNNPDVWIDYFEIDKNNNRLYHLDSKKDFLKEEYVLLKLYYDVRPDYIQHITHSGYLDKVYSSKDFNWNKNCISSDNYIDCSSGWAVFKVYNVEKGFGSSTFPIGVDGPQWNSSNSLLNESEYTIDLTGGYVFMDNPQYLELFVVADYNLTCEIEADSSIFIIDYDSNFVAMMFLIFFVISGLLFFMKKFVYAGSLLVLLGFVLLFSGFLPILSFIVIALGVVCIFVKI